MSAENGHGWTTASIEALPRLDVAHDPTSGFVLVYSRLHAHLPSAVAFVSELTSIGREADNSLAIPEAAVSRYHARVEHRPEGDFLIDLGSTNGTIVNGYRVREHRLVDHDLVRFGDTILRYAERSVFAYGAYRVDGSVVDLARPVRHGVTGSSLIGGYQIDALLEKLEKVAPAGISIVVLGESGTGKELVAREVHRLSGRKGPFQAINCAALPANLIESELFGYRKGAFTGATTDKTGLVRAAHGGTLFLDEIGDMPPEAQAKLLRVLQEREVLPIGATTPERVDVRIVCATHRDLDALVREQRFRGDLFARLREFTAELPPLRRRREDLFPLVRHFLARAGRTDTQVTFAFMLGITHYDWPYNVRELESAVRLACALSNKTELDLAYLPETVRRALERHGTEGAPSHRATERPTAPESAEPGPTRPLAPVLRPQVPSKEALHELLVRHQGNVAAVGRELGKERMQIHRWIKRYNIDLERYRTES